MDSGIDAVNQILAKNKFIQIDGSSHGHYSLMVALINKWAADLLRNQQAGTVHQIDVLCLMYDECGKFAIDEKEFVEEILFKLGLTAERETEVAYHQGFEDGVWLLKNLGLVA